MLEQDIYALWGGKQTAKGTPNTAPAHRLVQIGGDLNVAKDVGSQAYSDLSKYGGTVDWVNSVLGQGDPVIEATPTELAWLLWMFHGAETVTAITGPPAQSKHAFVPSSGRGHWGTFFKRIGQSVIQRQQFNDCLVTRLQIEGSTGQKDVRITPHVLSLDPAEVKTSDPVQAMPVDVPFLYTDGAASFTIDGSVFTGQSQFTLVLDDDVNLAFGDGVTPFDSYEGNPVVTIGITMLLDAAALGRYNNLVYGSSSPSAGTKPLKSITPLGSYGFSLKQKDTAGAINGRQFDLAIPGAGATGGGVRWQIPDAPGPNPDGGATEIALAGSMRPPSAGNAYTLDVYTAAADVAFTA